VERDVVKRLRAFSVQFGAQTWTGAVERRWNINGAIRPDPERVLAEPGKGFCREKDPKTSPAFMKLDRGSNEVAFADSIRSARREMK
jgi:hypothetical protein